MTKKFEAHIDSSEIHEGIPELGSSEIGKTVKCIVADCPAPNFTMGFGLAGGGYGPYEYCETCGKVISKSMDEQYE